MLTLTQKWNMRPSGIQYLDLCYLPFLGARKESGNHASQVRKYVRISQIFGQSPAG